MIAVHFPDAQFRVKKEQGSSYIFDVIRKKWLLLTKEEWVRQNIVSYLVRTLNYPSTVIALEKEIILNELKKRFDILVYNKTHEPWMLIECKAPHVNLSEKVLHQVLRYNITVPVEFIIISNGNATLGWQKSGSNLKLLEALPAWQ